MAPPARVLIVDDEVLVVEILRSCFADAGYRVDVALHGGDALTLMQHEPPNVMLLDISMPGMDGLQVLERVRASHPGLPVIVMTAMTDPALLRRAFELGAFDYVAKPFTLAHLEGIVGAALALRNEGGGEPANG